MPLRTVAALGLLAGCLALPIPAAAQGAQLQLPSFAHLERQASNVVDVTLGSGTLAFASRFVKADDEQSAEIKKLLAGIKSIAVRSYEFEAEHAYSKADIDAVRAQLARPGWTQLAQVRDRKKAQDVDVFIAMDEQRATGFAVIASQPRRFAIINVVGSLDFDQLAKLQGHLHLPEAGLEAIAETTL
jgi:hypothetical protein